MIIGFILGAGVGSLITGLVFVYEERKQAEQRGIEMAALLRALQRANEDLYRSGRNEDATQHQFSPAKLHL